MLKNKDLFYSVLIIVLLCLICNTNFYVTYIDNKIVYYVVSIGLKLAFLVFALIYSTKIKINNIEFHKPKSFDLAFLPFLVITISNFLVAISSNLVLTYEGNQYMALEIVTIFLAVLCEEVVFRGILIGYLNKYYSDAKTIIISGLLFGLIHFINFNGTNIIPVLLQILYASGLGLILGLVYVKSKNFSYVMIIHFLYLQSIPVKNLSFNLIFSK